MSERAKPGNAKRLEPCCEQALASWTPQLDCPTCGHDLRGLPTWADDINRELRRRPSRDDREAYDRDDAHYGGDE